MWFVICMVSVWDQYTANYSIKLEFVIRSHHLWFCFGTFLYVIYLSTHVVNRHLFTIASNNVLLLACKPNLSFSFSRLKTVMIKLHILNIMYCRLSIYNMTNCISCFNTHPVSSKFTIWQFRGGGGDLQCLMYNNIKTMLTSQSFWMTCLFSGDSGLPGKTGDKPGDTPGDAPSNTSSLPTLTSLQVLMTLALRPLPSLATEKEAATRSNSRSAASARSLTMSSKLLRI